MAGGRVIKNIVVKFLHRCLLDLEGEEKRRRMQLLTDVGCISFGTGAAIVCVVLEVGETAVLVTMLIAEWLHGTINYRKHL